MRPLFTWLTSLFPFLNVRQPSIEDIGLDRKSARRIVLAHIKEGCYSKCSEDIIICDNITTEAKFGWIFYLQTRRYLETLREPGGENKDVMLMLTSLLSGPIVVLRNGALHHLSTSLTPPLYSFQAERIAPDLWVPDHAKYCWHICLEKAVYTKKRQLVKRILQQRVCTQEAKDNALRIACENSDFRTIDLLLAYGADRNHRDYRGDTLLDHAEQDGNSRLARFLTQNGAVNRSIEGIRLSQDQLEHYLQLLSRNQREVIAALRALIFECDPTVNEFDRVCWFGYDKLTEVGVKSHWFEKCVMYLDPDGRLKYAIGPTRSGGCIELHIAAYYMSDVLRNQYHESLTNIAAPRGSMKFPQRDNIPASLIRDILIKGNDEIVRIEFDCERQRGAKRASIP